MADISKKWKERLKKIKDYKAAKESAEEMGGQLPDARYKAQVTSCELTESQSSGREQINLFVKVTEGDYEGEKAGIFLGLDEKSLPFTLSALKRLGFEVPETPDGIVDIVDEIADNEPEIIINVKNGWAGIQGAITEGGEASGEEADEEAEPASEEEPAEEAAEEEPAAEEAEVEEGSTVSFDLKGEETQAEVVEILEKENKLVVKTEDGKKYKVSAEKVSLVVPEDAAEEAEEEATEEVEDVEEEPKAKKKPAPAPAKKPVKKVVKRK